MDITFHKAGRLQFWINDYHIHHSFLGIVLILIGLFVILKFRKENEPMARVGLTVFVIGFQILIHWILFCYPEVGEFLLISFGR